MVKSVEQDNRAKGDYYKCLECGFFYKEKKWARKCQAWCKEHKTCNLELIKHAVKSIKKQKVG